MKEPRFLESIKLLNGAYHNLELHRSRMTRAALAAFGSRPGFDLYEALPKSVPKTGLHKVRLIYGQKLESVGITPYSMPSPKTMAVVQATELDYRHKYLNRSDIEILAANAPADDVIIAINGFVTDSSYANLVFENAHGLYTPEDPLLAGVKRQALLASGAIRTRRIKVSDIMDYDRVRLINAMIDLEDDVSVSSEALLVPSDG
ncbi:MAG: aminotransferase class IV [Deltaproteobacteria bacterium]|nr:aminotransferase class IV [Deltaproteobacteria bacterium]